MNNVRALWKPTVITPRPRPTVNAWLPVEICVPEPLHDVLVSWSPMHDCPPSTDIAFRTRDGRWMLTGTDLEMDGESAPTHWMALPLTPAGTLDVLPDAVPGIEVREIPDRRRNAALRTLVLTGSLMAHELTGIDDALTRAWEGALEQLRQAGGCR